MRTPDIVSWVLLAPRTALQEASDWDSLRVVGNPEVTILLAPTSGWPVIREEPVLTSGSCQWHVASWPLGDEKTQENSNFRKIEMANIKTEAVIGPDVT
jgi:hypothetical protein